MKKLVAVALIATLALGACALVLAQAGMPNPMVEVQDVSAVEQQLGVKLPLPEGAKVTACYVIDDTIGQVNFDWSSWQYTFRAKQAEAYEDISGISDPFAYYEKIEFDSITVELNLNEGRNGMAQWFANNATYALIVDENVNEDALIDVLVDIVYQ